MISQIVSINSQVKRISLQRGICSIIAHQSEVSLEIVSVLFQNQLWLEGKCSVDEMFQKKYGSTVFALSQIMKETNLSRGLTPGAVKSLEAKIKQNLGDFIYEKRNLPQIELLVKNSYLTRPYKPEGIQTKLLPPKRFIGIGYRDKGTARKPEIDGSPRWQEVASHVSTLEYKKEELSNDIRSSKTGLEAFGKLEEFLEVSAKLKRSTSVRRNSEDAKDAQRKR